MKISIFTFLFFFLYFFPTFGLEFGGIFINLVAFIIAFIYIQLKKRNSSFFSSYFISFIFISLSVLLIVSGIYDALVGRFELSAIFSLIRPLLIWTIVTASFVFWMKAGNILVKWNKLIDVMFYVVVLVTSLELLFPATESMFNYFYGPRNSKLSGPLGTSYFFGYITFFLSIHFLFLFRSKKTKKIFIKLITSSVIVFLADSKPPLVLLAFILPVLFFPTINFFKITSIYITVAVVFFYQNGLQMITEILTGLNIDSYNISSLIRLLNDAEGAGTYSVRQEQIDFALSQSAENYGFGVGLGRGMLLESWISYYGYRYGIIGLFFYMLLWIYLFLRLIIKSFGSGPHFKAIFIGLGFWFVSHPILLLSGGMNESGFTGLFSSIVLGFAIALLKRADNLAFIKT
jgi:hypothetical protein